MIQMMTNVIRLRIFDFHGQLNNDLTHLSQSRVKCDQRLMSRVQPCSHPCYKMEHAQKYVTLSLDGRELSESGIPERAISLTIPIPLFQSLQQKSNREQELQDKLQNLEKEKNDLSNKLTALQVLN